MTDQESAAPPWGVPADEPGLSTDEKRPPLARVLGWVAAVAVAAAVAMVIGLDLIVQQEDSVLDGVAALLSIGVILGAVVAVGFGFKRMVEKGLAWPARFLSLATVPLFVWLFVLSVHYDGTHKYPDGISTPRGTFAIIGSFCGIVAGLIAVSIAWVWSFLRREADKTPPEESTLWSAPLPESGWLRTLPPDEPGTHIAVTAEGRHLVTCSRHRREGVVRLWDVESGALVWERRGEGLSGKQLTVSSQDAVIAVAGSWFRVVLLSPADGTTQSSWRLLNAGSVMALSPRGRGLALRNGSGNVKIHDLVRGPSLRLSARDSTDDVTALAFSPDGRRLVAAGGYTGSLRVWDTDTGWHRFTMQQGSYVHCLSFTSDGTMLAAGGSDGSCRIWNPQTGQHIIDLSHGKGRVEVAFHPLGKLVATAGVDGAILVWDTVTEQPLVRMRHGAPVDRLVGNQQGTRLGSASHHLVRIWQWPVEGQSRPDEVGTASE